MIQIIRSHSRLNGLRFSALEFGLVGLVVLALAGYFLLAGASLLRVATLGITVNCVPVVWLGIGSLRAGESDIGVGAGRWADRATPEAPPGSPILEVLHRSMDTTIARVRLAQDRPDEARELPTRTREAQEASGAVADLISIGVLEAACAEATGHRAEALQALGRAVKLAAPGGYVRGFVDDGRSIAHLLSQGGGGFDAEAQDPAGSAGAQGVRIVDRVATRERGHDEGQELVADVRRAGGAPQVEEPIGPAPSGPGGGPAWLAGGARACHQAIVVEGRVNAVDGVG